MEPDNKIISNNKSKKTLIIIMSISIFIVLLLGGIGTKIYLNRQEKLVQQNTMEPQNEVIDNLKIDTSETYSIGQYTDETLITGGTVVEYQVGNYLKIIGISPDATSTYKVYCTITPETVVERITHSPNPDPLKIKEFPLIEEKVVFEGQIPVSSQVRVEIKYDKNEMNYESTNNICLNIGLFN